MIIQTRSKNQAVRFLPRLWVVRATFVHIWRNNILVGTYLLRKHSRRHSSYTGVKFYHILISVMVGYYLSDIIFYNHPYSALLIRLYRVEMGRIFVLCSVLYSLYLARLPNNRIRPIIR